MSTYFWIRKELPFARKEALVVLISEDRSDTGLYALTYQSHYDAGKQYSENDVKYAFLEVEVEDACGESSCPSTCSGERYAYEEKQCNIHTSAGFFLELLAAFFAFLKAPCEELTDDRLVAAPDEYLSGEEEDERYRQHISYHTHDQTPVPWEVHTGTKGNSAS